MFFILLSDKKHSRKKRHFQQCLPTDDNKFRLCLKTPPYHDTNKELGSTHLQSVLLMLFTSCILLSISKYMIMIPDNIFCLVFEVEEFNSCGKVKSKSDLGKQEFIELNFIYFILELAQFSKISFALFSFLERGGLDSCNSL